MAFIHGECNWRDAPQQVRADVAAMAAAVSGYPWASTEERAGSNDRLSWTWTTQRSPGSPQRGRAELGASDRRGHLHIATDLRLDERVGLARRLGVDPAEARETSDQALVLLAFERWGEGCFDELLGDGAFALLDERERRLYCWRDPAGVRPLYYRYEPGRRFVFSSDLRSLAAHPATPRRLDLAYARSALELGFGFQHPSRTLVAGVHKLPAGHALTVDASGVRVHRYWRPPIGGGRASRHDHDHVDELRELLGRAIRARLPEDGRGAGAHLSGGLDSSSIAVLAARELPGTDGRRLTGFSWAPSFETVPPIDDDERDLATAAARMGDVPLRFAPLRASDILDVLCRDLPLEPTHTLHYELATSRDAAEQGITTLLSGWGGDELVVFNGRGYFADLARRGRWRTLHRELRRQEAVQGASFRGAVRSRVLKPLLPTALNRALGWAPPPPPRVLPGELRPEVRALLADVEPLGEPDLRERPGVHRMQRSLLTDGHLQYRMESWASHGATLGITYLYPLLDRRLIEFALRIPDHLYFKDGWKRWLYRTAMDGVLPDTVRWHPIKHDSAMVVQYRQVEPDTIEPYYERLRRRRDNPFVDIDRLLPRPEGAAGQRGQVPVEDDAPTGGASWMAFTSLGLG